MFKTKKIEIDGITVEIKNGKKSPQIIIQSNSNDIDVLLNDNTIFSGFEKEEYQYIPKNIRNFISEYAYTFDSFEMDGSMVMACDMVFKGEDITAYFPQNAAKPIPFRLNNIADGKEYAKDVLEEFMEGDELKAAKKEVVEAWNMLRETLKDIGYTFAMSHYSDLYLGWWDILLSANDWDEEKFAKSVEAVTRYKQIIFKYEDQ